MDIEIFHFDYVKLQETTWTLRYFTVIYVKLQKKNRISAHQ